MKPDNYEVVSKLPGIQDEAVADEVANQLEDPYTVLTDTKGDKYHYLLAVRRVSES